jgi:DHA2 family multidrug resistance protein
MLYFGAIVLLPQLLQEVWLHRNMGGTGLAPVGVIPVLYRRSLVVLLISSICAGWSHSALLCTPSASTGAHIRLSREWIWRFRMAAIYLSGLRRGLLLYAADDDYAVRPAARAPGCGVEPVELTRTLAGSIGTSITTTMWTNRESMHHAHRPNRSPHNPNAQEMYNQLQGQDATAGIRLDSPANHQSGADYFRQ